MAASGPLWPDLTDPDELAQFAWSSLQGLLALKSAKQEHGRIQWREPRTTANHTRSASIRGMLRPCVRSGFFGTRPNNVRYKDDIEP